MKVGIIGAGTMGQGIAKAFAMVDGYEVALCDIKQEWAEGGKDKIAKGYARLVEKGKMTQEKVDADGNPIDDITNNGNGDGNSDSNANKDNQSSSSTGDRKSVV